MFYNQYTGTRIRTRVNVNPALLLQPLRHKVDSAFYPRWDVKNEHHPLFTMIITRKPSYRWQTRATRNHAKNCSNSTCLQRCRWQYWPIFIRCCCCVRNVRNPEKFSENSNLWSSRSSKVIDLGANRKPICDLLLVINSNFSCICYRFRDIHG